MLFLAVVPVALRLALLPYHPVPAPDVYDEFSHLLVADTLRHFRLANPPHPMHQFFETFFVLQEPTRSSIYPIGQGLALAIGWTVFGIPWAGVLLSTAALCSLCYWMLRAWTTPGWALLGGILAIFQFGPLNQWTNTYWGGAFAAAAGCLVFGALPRLRERPRAGTALLLGLGLAMHLLTRPYESIFLILGIILFWFPLLRSPWRLPALARPALAAGLVPVVLAIGITLLQNKRVTGSWIALPYTLSQYQYGVPASLTFQARPEPHRQLTREQELDYRMQRGFRSAERDTPATYLQRLAFRIRYYRFFFYAPLYLALIAFVSALREYRYAWVALNAVIFAIGVNFFPAFQFHYLAAIVCLFVLMSVEGLRRLAEWPGGSAAARLIIYLCITQFLLWYGAHVMDRQTLASQVRNYDLWNSINHQNPERRIDVNRRIAAIPGRLLILVRYWPQHVFQEEWVWNEADVDRARVVWARDRGDAENEKIRRYFPDRSVWLLEPDARPPKLTAYQPQPAAPQPERKKEQPNPKDEKKPRLVLEPVL